MAEDQNVSLLNFVNSISPLKLDTRKIMHFFDIMIFHNILQNNEEEFAHR